MTAKTILNDWHKANNARMVDFHGWEMPLHYGSQIDEHHQVRNHAGLFDVSHMTILDILGAGGRQFLHTLLTNNVDLLEHNGKALYSCMCNEHGGIVDDLIVYQRATDNYRLVLNSATKARDLEWIHKQAEGFAIGLQERNELSIIAVQGPEAIRKTLDILPPTLSDKVSTLSRFECVEYDDLFIGYTGYTGEDGLEIMAPETDILQLWNDLVGAGVKPCGLGARDTLRLEAGLFLYGQDMDETTTPLESGLGWTVKWEPENRAFIGKGALLSQKQNGVLRKMIGLILQGKGIMRTGQHVQISGESDGIITSGGWSPTLEKSIAFARVPIHTDEEVLVDIRGQRIPAKVVKPAFVRKGKILI